MHNDPAAGVTERLGLLSELVFREALKGSAVIFMAPVDLEALRTRAQELQETSEAIVASADDAQRDLTDDEVSTIEANSAEVARLTKQINARAALTLPTPAAPGRRTAAEPRDPQNRMVPARPRSEDGRGPFRNLGEFAMHVRNGCLAGGQISPELRNAQTTYGGEDSGADGGFAVPPTFKTEIWTKVLGEENLLNRCAGLTTGGNSITIPKDETTPWQTSGGVQAYWESEAAQVAASKPDLSMSQIRLAKLMALVPVSDELLEDAPGLQSWLSAKAPAKMAAKINTAIVSGTGVGQPLGILNAPCTITVAEETSQVAASIYFANVEKMWSRMYAPCRRNAVWLINQDAEPQLNGMAFDPKATSKVPVYLPAGMLSEGPYGTLMGRPVVPIEACETVGTVGDIILADLTAYWALTKGTDIRQDVSMHLYFDQGSMAFRWTFRLNGQPAWGKNITPQNGTNTRSCFVTLATRS